MLLNWKVTRLNRRQTLIELVNITIDLFTFVSVLLLHESDWRSKFIVVTVNGLLLHVNVLAEFSGLVFCFVNECNVGVDDKWTEFVVWVIL
jgi:hypothetical protein